MKLPFSAPFFRYVKRHHISHAALSLCAVADDEEKNRLEDYQRQAAAATTTIEEVMSLKDRNPE